MKKAERHLTIWLPIVKQIFWKLYWVEKWETYTVDNGKVYKDGKRYL